ncbi:MAG: 2,3-bisphosphoglycerate-independent phosphoglycerate mutase, partial [Candidatus ainarchaeum sp.]|nr:2,3-bisphosphoglycerate-independent phosphoglycerate mutase [Candidatus ainarchaeum sp.]
MNNKNLLLVVLDGIGLYKDYEGNAAFRADTKTLDTLINKYPFVEIDASGEAVGLPKGQLGGSEIGHQTIGAGKIIESDLLRINKAIKDKSFYKNKVLLSTIKKAKNNNIHLVGLLSDGGVHSHIDHLFAILDVISKNKTNDVFLHLFTDGRDVPPKSAQLYISRLSEYLEKLKITNRVYIASISGRYYAMDRDNRWDRQKIVYDLLVSGKGNKFYSTSDFIKNSYKKQVTDEFLWPTLLEERGLIKKNDSVIFFNFRSDRAKQLTNMFTDNSFNYFKTKKLDLNFTTFTQYDSSFKSVDVMFKPIKYKDGLGQIFSKQKFKQLRIAETEKYAHVTYFFNQGQEKPNNLEHRILIDSKKIKTYDLDPTMSAKKITNKLLPLLNKDYKFTLLNFANGDMVGHTGDLEASIEAVSFVDKQVERILKKVDLEKTIVLITADHGNCEEMFYENKTICTSHTLNPVPLILVSNTDYKLKNIKNGSLANIAPTILDLLDLKIPSYMEKSLLIKDSKKVTPKVTKQVTPKVTKKTKPKVTKKTKPKVTKKTKPKVTKKTKPKVTKKTKPKVTK